MPHPSTAAWWRTITARSRTSAAKTGIPEPQDWFYTLLRMPDVTTKTEVEELSDEEWEVARKPSNRPLHQLVDFRRQEGAALEKKFTEKIDNIEPCCFADRTL